MTFQELCDDCWRELPAVRKWIAGRDTSMKLLADAVMEFEPERVELCLTADEYADYETRLLDKVKKRNCVGDGFAILTFLLVTIAAAVISWLIQRWLDNHFPKEQLDSWREEIAR